MDNFTSGLVTSMGGAAVRHITTTVGGALIARGLMDSSDMNSLLGCTMFLAGLAWSIYQKYSAQGKLQALQPVQGSATTKA